MNNESFHNFESLSLSDDEQEKIAKALDTVIQTAVNNAEARGLGIPAEARPVFDLNALIEMENEKQVRIERETYSINTDRFAVHAGDLKIDLHGSLKEIKKGKYVCRGVWVNGRNLYFVLEKNQDEVQFFKEPALGDEISGMFTGEEASPIEEDLQDLQMRIEDNYRELSSLIEQHTNLAETKLLPGTLMTVEEGQKYVKMLEEVRTQQIPFELGPDRAEYSVKMNPQYADETHNPQGLYLSLFTQGERTALETRYIPIGIVDKEGELFGWTVAQVRYVTEVQNPGKVVNEYITYVDDSEMLSRYEFDVKPNVEQYAKENAAVSTVQNYFEELFEGGSPDLSEVEAALQAVDRLVVEEFAEELAQMIDLYHSQNPEFMALAEELQRELILAKDTFAKREYFTQFVSLYLAYKIQSATKKLDEQQVVEAIKDGSAKIFAFTELKDFLKYLISLRGNRKILLDW